jgi:hypothetical protein
VKDEPGFIELAANRLLGKCPADAEYPWYISPRGEVDPPKLRFRMSYAEEDYTAGPDEVPLSFYLELAGISRAGAALALGFSRHEVGLALGMDKRNVASEVRRVQCLLPRLMGQRRLTRPRKTKHCNAGAERCRRLGYCPYALPPWVRRQDDIRAEARRWPHGGHRRRLMEIAAEVRHSIIDKCEDLIRLQLQMREISARLARGVEQPPDVQEYLRKTAGEIRMCSYMIMEKLGAVA